MVLIIFFNFIFAINAIKSQYGVNINKLFYLSSNLFNLFYANNGKQS